MQASDFYRKKATRRDGLQSSRDIVEAAARLLGERGGKALTTEKLAKTSGYSSGVIFYRFSCKNDIIRAVIASTYEENFQQVITKLEFKTNLDIEIAVEIIVMHYYHLTVQNRTFMMRILNKALADPYFMKIAVNHQYNISEFLINHIKINCLQASNETTINLVPVFNGILFGSFHSASLSYMNGVNEQQVKCIKKSLGFILTC